MSQVPIRSLGRLILCLAGYASHIFVGPIAVFGEDTKSHAAPPPKIDHILLEVSNLAASIRFYRDFLGLHLKSRIFGFAMLESGNVGVFLWNHRWNWEKPRSSGERQGLGMYPHLEVGDAAAIVDRARKAGYRIVQEPRKYSWGTEAFIADPDGYIWAFVSPPK
jgi:catechol 2,3-dioxygenase-like lactoylglutathione lyase family enzyme